MATGSINEVELPSAMSASLRVARLHFWFVRRGGAERVVESLADMFPQADIFAPVMDPSWRDTGRLLAGRVATRSSGTRGGVFRAIQP